MSVGWRAVVLIITAVVLLSIVKKSRFVPPREQAAFLHYSTGSVLVKMVGIGNKDGIYRFSDGVTLGSVKKMTASVGLLPVVVDGRECRLMKNGDVVEIGLKGDNHADFTLKRMSSAEMLLLGIPLDPDVMTVGDWEALPGIGPSLAESIVRDRQKYGSFHGVEGLQRVPGIGAGKIRSLRRFF